MVSPHAAERAVLPLARRRRGRHWQQAARQACELGQAAGWGRGGGWSRNVMLVGQGSSCSGQQAAAVQAAAQVGRPQSLPSAAATPRLLDHDVGATAADPPLQLPAARGCCGRGGRTRGGHACGGHACGGRARGGRAAAARQGRRLNAIAAPALHRAPAGLRPRHSKPMRAEQLLWGPAGRTERAQRGWLPVIWGVADLSSCLENWGVV